MAGDFTRDVPPQKPDNSDNIIAKLAKETGSKVGDTAALNVAPGADKSVTDLPKVAIGAGKDGATNVAEIAQQLAPTNIRDTKAVVEAGKTLTDMVNDAIKKLNNGNRKPAETLSQGITLAAESISKQRENLNPQINSVQTAMDKAVGSRDTNMA